MIPREHDFQVGEWRVEPLHNEIAGPNGTKKLEPRVMRLLVCLAERAGQLVSRDELTERLWEGSFVTDEVLTQSVSELRKALGDDPKEPRFVQTVPKKGYRLIAPTTGPPRRKGPRRFTASSIRHHPWILVSGLLVVGGGAIWMRSSRETPDTRAVVRALVPPPAGGSFFLEAEGPGPAVVSPDGARLAFAARDETGITRLWVRDVEALRPRALPGTEEARYPFWSPDGQSLGFFSSKALKRVDTEVGRAKTVVETPNGKGGSWNDTGTIIYAAGARRSLFSVSLNDDTPKPLTELEPGEISHAHPRFLPDGKRFLYVARRATRDGHRLKLGSLDGGASRDVMETGSQGEVAGSYLWTVQSETLVAFPFDTIAGRIAGEPIPVEENVGILPFAALGLFSVSRSGVLAYHSGWAPEETSLRVRERDGMPSGEVGTRGRHIYVELSPDGARAAVVTTDSEANEDIWLHSVTGGSSARFTFHIDADGEAVWSPDGSRIAFARLPSGIYVKPVSGVSEAEILRERHPDDGFYLYPGDWAPGGREIVCFSFSEADGRNDLWVLSLDNPEELIPIQPSPFNEWQPALSPDGRWLAYSSDESGRQQVYVTPFPSGGTKWQISSDGGAFPEWSDAGGELFYLDEDNVLQSVPIRSNEDSIEAGEPVSLFQSRARRGWTDPYAVTPDGQRFLINTVEDPVAPSAVTLVVGWPAELATR